MKALILANDADLVSKTSIALRLRWPDLNLTVADRERERHGAFVDESLDMMFIVGTGFDADAIALVREIRRASDVLMFVVGAGAAEADMAEALEAGADDYISTPISESLLVARVCAALRRAGRIAAERGAALEYGDLMIDPTSHETRLGGRPLYLTPTEFSLLHHLAQQQGKVVTQQALESVVWGQPDRLYVDVLRKHMQRLRRKLESRRGSHTTITTIPRVGYKLAHQQKVRRRR